MLESKGVTQLMDAMMREILLGLLYRIERLETLRSPKTGTLTRLPPLETAAQQAEAMAAMRARLTILEELSGS